ncbi:MAG: S9 family peptidase [Bacteroidota bacterium]|nr:S9 family peptidase [Bacteroidota bacterium]
MKRLIVSLAVLLSVTAVHAQSGREPVTAGDLLKIKQLGSIAVSPDGRYVAYAVRSIVPDPDKAYKYRSQIWIAPVSGREVPWQLTYGEGGATSPTWNPDGEHITFVRTLDDSARLFEIAVYGGEAREILNYEHSPSQPIWSPDGRYILFSSSLTGQELRELTGQPPVWSDERPGRGSDDHTRADPDPDGSLEAVRAWLHANAEDANPRLFTRLNLQGELALAPEPRYRHFFVADMEAPDGPEVHRVTGGHYSYGDATWLPDSRQLIVSGYPESTLHPDRIQDRELFLVDVPDGKRQRLLDVEGYRLSSPVLSTDGNQIAFLARDLEDPGYAQTEIGLFALDGRSAPAMITLDFDRSASSVQWSHDGWFLYFTAPSEGGFPLFRVEVTEAVQRPSGPEDALADTLAADSVAAPARDVFSREELVRQDFPVRQMTDVEQGIRDYQITSASAYMVVTDTRNPYELYSSTMDFQSPQQLSTHNSAWLNSKAVSVPTSHTLRVDTLEIPYWIIRPTFQVPGRTYPLMVAIHGGPASMWGPGEATMWHEFQFFASKGYGIVYSNPRGSGGYGTAWRRANYEDWGVGPAGDVLAAAGEVVQRQRWVDADRQVVTGGSYAGYLTAWIVGQDHRFKAAVAQRGVYDLETFFGEGNAWRLVPNHFGGFPWERGPLLRANSPITFVDLIQTPLLIMHADNDLRTGVIQSEVLYKSLKALGRPVEYVRYPNAGHDLSRSGNPKQRMDRLLRIWEFMERYVGADR